MSRKCLYLSEFHVGDKFITANQTVTETAVVLFAGITQNFNPVHMDQSYAEKLPFGTRIAHGLLGASIATGLWSSLGLVEGSAIAALDTSWSFKAGIKFNDTIHDEVEVIDVKRSSSKPDRGVLTVQINVVNQEGKLCQVGITKALLKWEAPED